MIISTECNKRLGAKIETNKFQVLGCGKAHHLD
jgi:hypothetical protein